MAYPYPYMTNPGYAKINGGTVYYIFAAPSTNAALRNELAVLESFLAAWNADKSDNPNRALGNRKTVRKPSNTKAQPPGIKRIIVHSQNHRSTLSSRGQPKHISISLYTDIGWSKSPKEGGAYIHVFCKNEDAAYGFADFEIYNDKARLLDRGDYITGVTAAGAHFLGTLGSGNLSAEAIKKEAEAKARAAQEAKMEAARKAAAAAANKRAAEIQKEQAQRAAEQARKAAEAKRNAAANAAAAAKVAAAKNAAAKAAAAKKAAVKK